MPDGDDTNDYPERLLAGSDRPRPLPTHLRARLEEALEGVATTESARPLSGEVRDKLEVSLRPEAPRGPRKTWREWAPRLSVAAAVIIALAIFVPALTHGPGPATSHSAAGPLSTRSGLSMRAATPGALARPDHGGAVANPSPAPVSSTTPDANGAGNANGPAGNARAANSNGPTANSKGPTANASAPTANASAPTPTIPSARLGPPTTSGRPTVLGPDKSDLGAPQAAFTASTPAVNGVSPASGPTSGGQWVTVRGTNLSGATGVDFGRVRASRVNAVSATELRALSPAHPAGHVDVVVKGPAGQSEVLPADRYSFAP
jgi:hypothetical protein